jgi:hypothetical protein
VRDWVVNEIVTVRAGSVPRAAVTRIAADGAVKEGRDIYVAQLIKVRLKPGKDLAEAAVHLRAAEQP